MALIPSVDSHAHSFRARQRRQVGEDGGGGRPNPDRADGTTPSRAARAATPHSAGTASVVDGAGGLEQSERAGTAIQVEPVISVSAARAATPISTLTFRGNDAVGRLAEALTALGNGVVVTRGNFWPGTPPNRGTPAGSYPGTYIAGLSNEAETEVGGRRLVNDDLVNLPNPLFLAFRVEGSDHWMDPFDTERFELLNPEQSLELAEGVLTTTLELRDRNTGQETRFQFERFVDQVDPHRAYLRAQITPLNYSGTITVRSGIDGSVENKGVPRYYDLTSSHLLPARPPVPFGDGLELTMRTRTSGIEISEAERVRVFQGPGASDAELFPHRNLLSEGGPQIFQQFALEAKQGEPLIVEKAVGIVTTHERGVEAPSLDARRIASEAPRFHEAVASHAAAWKTRWDAHRIQLEGGKEAADAQLALDVHAYHLMSTASFHTARVGAGMPARGWTGEPYRGHIFWDVSLIAPFFDLAEPAIAAALLQYRIDRLPQAIENAKLDGGFAGAMFPWQSGLRGTETTPTEHYNPIGENWGPDNSRRQRHISFDIFYDAYHYWRRTGDDAFLINGGGDLMLQIARFGGSLARRGEDGRFHTAGLVGPDEFHEHHNGEAGVRDNAYTNLMIAWALGKISEVLETLSVEARENLLSRNGVGEAELRHWDEVSHRMNVVLDENGIISQFDGYFDLEELTEEHLAELAEKYTSLERMDRVLKAEGLSPDDYKVGKQADALMIFYMLSLSEVQALFDRLGHHVDRDVLEKNYDYYLPRTSHGSTLSRVVHGQLAWLLGRQNEAMAWYRDVLASDLDDTQGGTTAEAIHTGVMAASIDFVRRAMLEMEVRDDGTVTVNPHFPPGYERITLPPVHVRGRQIRVSATPNEVQLSVTGLGYGESQEFEIFGRPHTLTGSSEYRFTRPESEQRVRVAALDGVEEVEVQLDTTEHLTQVMRGLRDAQRRIVPRLLEGAEPDSRDVAYLRGALTALTEAQARGRVDAGGTDMPIDLHYEVTELRKDLALIEGGEAALYALLRELHPDFEKEVDELVNRLGDRDWGWVFDRDGTLNNHCGRYATSVQPAWIASFLTRHARSNDRPNVILTAAPLEDGLAELSTMPRDAAVLAGGYGRVYQDTAGRIGRRENSAELDARLATADAALRALIHGNARNRKFLSIGSGYQNKPDQLTVARQDPTGSIELDESARLLAEVQILVARLNEEEGQEIYRLHDDGRDLSIRVHQPGEGGTSFGKDDGVHFLDQELDLGLDEGPTLGGGDTASDFKIVNGVRELAGDAPVQSVFIVNDAKFAAEVRAIDPDAHLVSSPDVLVTALYRHAQQREAAAA